MSDIQDQIAGLSPEKRKLVLQALRRRAAAPRGDQPDRGGQPATRRVSRDSSLALSFSQQRLWLLDHIEGGSAHYNECGAMYIEGPLRVDALRQSLSEIVRRHEVLRTCFPAQDGTPVQQIQPAMAVDLPVRDLQDVPAGAQDARLQQQVAEQAQQSFDLARGPLYQFQLARLGPQTHVLILAFHHIVFDRWSGYVFNRELLALYEAYCHGQASPLPELPIQYADFTVRQRAWFDGDQFQPDLDYWRQQLTGVPALLGLPTDRPRPAVQTFRGRQHNSQISGRLLRTINDFSQQSSATPFMTLLAAYATLLARYSGQGDVVVGSPIANRGQRDIEDLIGFFVNTLALRIDLSGDPSFAELLQRVRQMALDAYAHQDVPFERLVEELQPERRLSHSPIFQAMLVYQNTPLMTDLPAGLQIRPLEIDNVTSKFDLTVLVHEYPDELDCVWEYNADLFDVETIERMAGHFETLLSAAVAEPETPISELPLLGPDERHRILVQWNDTGSEKSYRACLHRMFEDQAAATPNAVAVECDEHQLTYLELNEKANQLARRLQAMGVGADVPVGICVDRTRDMVIGVLGILKAEGAYVPLDPNYPHDRLQRMLSQSRAPVLVTQSRWLDVLPQTEAQVVCLDADWPSISQQSTANLPGESNPENLLYVIFTSGSTGEPKAVALEHRGLANLILWQLDHRPLAANCRTLQFASLSFDASFQEMFSCWCSGGTLVLVADEIRRDAPALLDYLIDRRIERLFLPFVALHHLAEVAESSGNIPTSLREVVPSGEQLQITPAISRLFQKLDGCVMENVYGPSECHVVTAYTLAADVDRWPTLPPIGRGIANTQLYVLDERLQPVPIGVRGELYIGGHNLGRGYLHDPQRTAERFLSLTFDGGPPTRVYKSGDLVRFLNDGNIEFLGRADGQIKIRGFRVELGEIEAVLCRHPDVADAAAAVRGEGVEDKQLVAYVVPQPGREPDPAEWIRFLKRQLPEYMLPAYFVHLDALPLTPTGKVDRRSLPAPNPEDMRAEETYVAPRTPTEEVLAGIWSDVLQQPQIGVLDNFFHRGGHSLLATQLVSRVGAAFQVELSVRMMFESPTVAEMAQVVDDKRRSGGAATAASLERIPRDGDLPLSFAQQRLWFLEQLEGPSETYNISTAVRLAGQLDPEVLLRSLQEVVRRHESLRTTFPAVRGKPVQKIGDEGGLHVDTFDLRRLVGDAQRAELQRGIEAETTYTFDLATGPLFRCALFELGEQEHVLVVTLHHIISDGWSASILVKELAALYEAHVQGEPCVLPELPLQYADFAAWQREWLRDDVLQAQLDFWRQHLDGAPALLELPTDRPRPPVQTYRGRTTWFELGAELAGKLEQLSRQCKTTLFMTLHAAFAALMSRYSGQDDFVLGSGVANRNRLETESLVGFFVNILPLRVDLAGNPTFRELLDRVRDVDLAAYDHQDVPFEKLVEQLQPERNMGHTPIFQVNFTLQNLPNQQVQLPGLTVETVEVDGTTSRFDLTVLMQPHEDGLRCVIEYRTDLFDAETIDRLAGHYRVLLESVVADHEQPIGQIPLLTDGERQQLLVQWNDTAADYHQAMCLHQLFEEQVARTPHAVAAVFEDQQLDYAQLNARANRLAHYLRKCGVGPDVLVGLCVERSLEMVIGILGILKAGGAYVPLDPDYPAERLAFMLQDAQAPLLLTRQALLERLPAHQAQVVCLDADFDQIDPPSEDNLPSQANAENLAYVIYTSGSTGRPKGSLITHACVTRLFAATQDWFEFGEQDVWTLFHSFAFDFSVWELWGALLFGGKLVIVPYWISRSAEEFRHLLRQEGVTVLNQTPSAFFALMRADEASPPEEGLNLRWVIFGGEALNVEGLQPWFDRHGDQMPRLVNMYGITETTVHVTYRPLSVQDLTDATGSPIGIGIPDLQLYVLDPQQNPAPIGVAGELYVGGAGLSRGYLNRPELTAEKFIANPFSTEAGSRLYKTGDLCRWLPEGNLEFLGRLDQQVKIRGFRIELGEIESALLTHCQVREAAVLAREDQPDHKRLAAYVVPAQKSSPQDESQEFTWLPNGLQVAHFNRGETDLVYREIFQDESYLRHGVCLHDGACVFDVGANIGLFSLFVHQHCSHAQVYAFEPIPPTFNVLQTNVALYNLPVKLFECGLSDRAGEATFTFYPQVSVMSGVYADAAEDEQVTRTYLRNQEELDSTFADELLEGRFAVEKFACQLRTLSEIIQEEQIPTIDLLKIDVEKSELEVLAGIRQEDWAKIRQVVLEVHDVEGRLDQATALLKRHGFHVTVEQDVKLAGTGLFNLYAVHPARPPQRDATTVTPGALQSLTLSSAELRRHLGETLPEYMVPSAFVVLDSLPLTPHGKLDRQALPAPEGGLESDNRYVPPRNPLEEELCTIWHEVLGLDRVGAHDNFFELGGHSLIATQVISRVRESFRVEVPLRRLFEAPTVAELAEQIDSERRCSAGQTGAIGRSEREGPPVLSFAQERLWFLDQLEPGNPFYNVPIALTLKGQLDVAALAGAIQQVVRRHAVLRSSYPAVDGKPGQVIADRLEVPLPVADLSELPDAARAEEVSRRVANDTRQPFDLAAGPLIRTQLLRLGLDDHVLLFTMHHIVSDGWSLSVLIDELVPLYRAGRTATSAADGSPPVPLHDVLPDLPIQYGDFAAWQRQWLEGEVIELQLTYWRQQLAEVPPVLELPTDRPRPPVQSYRGSSVKFTVDAATITPLRSLCQERETTLFMTLLAAWAALLYRYSGQDDLVIGSPIANRNRREIEPLIGFFVNTLALRVDLSGNPTFGELVDRVRQVALDAYTHQDLPFERLVDEIQPERDLSLNPLFQVMFALQNMSANELELPDLTVGFLETKRVSALFDLVLDTWEVGDSLVGVLEYNTDLFDEPTIERLVESFQTLLHQVAAKPSSRVDETPLLSDAQQQRMLEMGRGPRAAYCVERTIQQLFEETAARHADRVALVHNARQVTYAELNARANRIAHSLRARGLARGDFVGILLDRGSDCLAAMLGILKAGGAFLPIDPAYPADRIRYMLADSGIRTLVSRAETYAACANDADRPAPDLCLLDLASDALQTQPDINPPHVNAADDVAYMLYTSGSTGLPKGALVRHNGAVNHIFAEFDLLAFHPDSAFLQSAPSSSDISVWQFLAPVLIGGKTVVADYETVCDPSRLFQTIESESVTLIELVPVVMNELLEYAHTLAAAERQLPDLQWAMITGEAAPVSVVNRWLETYPGIRLVNAYGPTEAADDICQHVIDRPLPAGSLNVPIGRPLANLTLYVLDRNLRLVPGGVPGEICVAGIGVGAGYWNNETKTRESFVANPYGRDRHDRMLYRTGDLGRWLPDGSLECLDRLDRQVKLRGFRIELGEVEGVLHLHPAVREAAVIVREDQPDDKRLVAYVAPHEASEPVRRHLGELKLQQVTLWQDLHEDSYRDTLDYGDPTFNVIGWDSNYTNQPLPREDMHEYVDFTIERIRRLQPRRLLEIGCGTGLIMFPLLPHVEAYAGTDLSQVTIHRLQQLQQSADLQRQIAGLAAARLVARRADDVTWIEPGSFDTAVLPSVVQYFPGIDYLLQVLDGLIRHVLAPGGAIFLGDIRNLPLLEAFHASVQLFKADRDLAVTELAQRVRDQLAREQELAIDPEFFTALTGHFPEIAHVEVLPKRGHRQNEMTRFRYDVLIRLHRSASSHNADPESPATASRSHSTCPDAIEWIDWQRERPSAAELHRRLADEQPDVLALCQVANRRVQQALQTVAWLADGPAVDNAGQLEDALAQHEFDGIEPEQLWQLAEQLPYDAQVAVARGDRDGRLDVVFTRREADASASGLDKTARNTGAGSFEPKPWSAYANNPLREKLAGKLAPELREFLRTKMPNYMVPSDMVILEALPLTPAGKIDRQSLPAPEARRADTDGYVAPRNADEQSMCRIWADVLGVERVGVRDNFFELGGHSLKATQVVSRIHRELSVEIALREIFSHPTVADLAESLVGRRSSQVAVISKTPDAEHYELSHAQRRLWVLSQMEDGLAAYNMPAALRLDGEIDLAAFQQSLDALVERHESLRTAFIVVDGKPRQQVAAPAQVPIRVVDLTGELDPERRARELAQADAVAPFDLQSGGLLRVTLLKLAAEEHGLLFNIHHIVSDDWSMNLLVREFVQLYDAFRRGQPSPLPPLPLQYRDYASWQNRHLTGDESAADRDYWLAKLGGDLPLLDLPSDHPRPPVKTYRGRALAWHLDALQTAALERYGRQRGASLFMTFVALLKVLLYRYSGQEDIVVGFPIAGRDHPDLESQIGFFVNTLPLRTRLREDISFDALLDQVKTTATEAYEHQAYPFDRLVDELEVARDVSRHPLFDVVVVMQSDPPEELSLDGVRISGLVDEYEGSKFDLHFAVEQRDGRLEGAIVYNTDLFLPERIERMSRHLGELIHNVLAAPDTSVSRIHLLPADERRQLLADDQRPPAEEPSAKSLIDIFEQQAARTPRAVAVVCAAAEGEDKSAGQQRTYAQLNEQANRLAHRLKDLGVGPEALVGLCVERSADMVAAILGILKAGGAYVPLDPAQPGERLALMLEDARVEVLVTQQALQTRLPKHSARTVCLDAERDVIAGSCPENLPPVAAPDSTAYVIFTSGSTGRPKGVPVTHHNVMRLFTATDAWFHFGPQDVWTLFHSYAFDFSVWEMWGALLYGGRLVVVPHWTSRSPEAFYGLLAEERVTVLNQTPSAFRQLIAVEEQPGAARDLDLRVVVFGGEALDVQSLRPWMQRHGDRHPQLVNMYGITETTVHVTYRPVTAADLDRPGNRIGHPIPDLQIYLLDQHQQLVPTGVPGEICVGGAGVARGYLHRPELTDERFVAHPFSDDPDARLYRSGDLGRYLPDGDIEYLGRIDHQVQIRGFRVELGEIEAALATHPDVRQPVIIAGIQAAETRLIAYFLSAGATAPTTGELRRHLADKLPDYMIPSAFVQLEKFPLTENGKLDRQSLPAPSDSRPEVDAEYRQPVSELEKTLAGILGEVLGITRVGVHDNFFDLGAHSLALMEVHRKLQDRLDRKLPVVLLFQHPTVSALADHLGTPADEGAGAANRASRDRAAQRKAARRRQRERRN